MVRAMLGKDVSLKFCAWGCSAACHAVNSTENAKIPTESYKKTEISREN